MMVIDNFRGEYSFLSNFYYVKISYGGLIYPSVENAFQAQKCSNVDFRQKFVNISPSNSKKLGRGIPLVENWEENKEAIMLQLCSIKFKIPFLQKKLIETYPATLVEGNYWFDTFWGICGGVGQNKLGLILMKIRDILRKEAENESIY
jgi:ribA/ribD-fused uncharacterized protein